MTTSSERSTPFTHQAASLEEAARAVGRHRTVCCIGVFDGVHLGHQRLVGAALAEARRRRCWSLALTFRNHPLSVLAPAYAPLLLTDAEEKVRRLTALHPSVVAAVPFDHSVGDLEPEAFVEQVLAGRFRAASVWCGADFRFGREGRGDIALLRRIGRRFELAAHTIAPVLLHGRVVSSTWIRELVERGEVEPAAACLGCPHVIRGTVARGHGRGRRLGYPTANVAAPPGIVLPADGIYAVRAEAGGRLYDGVMHVGPAPTFGVAERRLEAYLFDFHGELVGQTLAVHFVARLRDVRQFRSPDQLVAQMEADVQGARGILRSRTSGQSPKR